MKEPSISEVAATAKKNFQVRVRDFKIPVVRDAVVVGKESPIGPEAMSRALALMNGRPFRRIDVEMDIIAAVIVRQDILKRLSVEDLKTLMAESIKGLMSPHEVLVIEIDAELQFEFKR